MADHIILQLWKIFLTFQTSWIQCVSQRRFASLYLLQNQFSPFLWWGFSFRGQQRTQKFLKIDLSTALLQCNASNWLCLPDVEWTIHYTQRESGTADISNSPIVSSSLGTNSGLLCWMTRIFQAVLAPLTVWSLLTHRNLHVGFSIRLDNVFRLSFFRGSHTDFRVLSSLSWTNSWNLSVWSAECLLWHF